MKKYWKMYLLLSISVLAIGTFYINSTFSKNDYPVYTIEKQSGDEKEIESVILFGDYYDDYYNKEVKLTVEGMTYSNEESILSQMIDPKFDPQIKKLQKEYWNFTRGKVTTAVNYFSNDKYLAYSNMAFDSSYSVDHNGYTFQISVLNKETNKTTSFDMKVPNAEAFAYVSTASVQMVGDELKVITRNATDGFDNIDFYLYTFDVANKKLKSGEIVFANPNNNANDGIDYYQLDERTINHQSDDALFYQVTVKDNNVEDLKLHIYNLSTGELVTEELPDNLYGTDSPSLYDGSNIYFTKWNEEKSKIISYNVSKSKIENTIEFDIPLHVISVNDGKLYVVGFEGESDRLIVVDLKSGNTLYEGDVVLKRDKETKNDMNNLQFYNIGFK